MRFLRHSSVGNTVWDSNWYFLPEGRFRLFLGSDPFISLGSDPFISLGSNPFISLGSDPFIFLGSDPVFACSVGLGS